MAVRSLLAGVSLAALGSVSASAADLIIPTTPQPIYEAAGFNWEGLYAGVRIGGLGVDAGNAVANIIGSGVIGAAVGVNFIPVDPLLLGVEITGDYAWGNNLSTTQFFVNLRAGAVVTDSVLLYGLGGVGVGTLNNIDVNSYQLGGGIEVAVTDAVTVRGEIVGVGDFDDGDNDFFDAARATVGVFYHF